MEKQESCIYPYFAEPNIHEIVKITPNGVLTDVRAIEAPGRPFGIAGDAARNLWITLADGNKTSRLQMQ